MDTVAGRVDCDPAQLIAEQRPRIHRYLLGMARDPHAAEDLTQETLLRALRGTGSLRDRAALVSLLHRIATNVFLDWVRAEERTPGRADATTAGLGAELPDPGPGADRLAEQADMSGCVDAFVHELPDDYRAAVLLHDAYGLPAREIAELLGVSVPTAKIRIHRGRAKLRAALDEGCEFATDDRGITVCDPVSAPRPSRRPGS